MNELTYTWTTCPDNHYYKLRSNVYANDLKIKIPFVDGFDNISDHLIIKRNNKLIGGARLTIGSKIGIPLEDETCLLDKIFSKKELEEYGYGEVTRLFLDEKFRIPKTVSSIYSLMNSKRKIYAIHYLLSFQPEKQTRLTSIICKNLGYNTKIIKVKELCPDSLYHSLGNIYLIIITNPRDLKWGKLKLSK